MTSGVATDLSADLLQSLDMGVPQTTETPAKQPENAPEAEQADVQEHVETQSSDDQPAEGAEPSQDQSFEYFNDLEQVLDVEDTSALYALKLKLGDGKELPIGQLKDIAREHDKLQQELETLRAQQPQQPQFQQPQQPQFQQPQAAQYPQDMPQEIQKTAIQLEALAMNEAQIDWEQEEKVDPGQAALLKQRYSEARGKLQTALQQQQQIYQQQQAQQQQQYIAQAQQELLRQIPEWNDMQAFEADRKHMYETASRYGYEPSDIDGVSDPRALRVWRDYAQLLQKIEQAKANAKQVEQKGDVRLKAANFKTSKARQMNELVSRAKQAGDRRSIHEAEKALLHDAGFI